MDTNEYYQQLLGINQMLEVLSDGPEKDELLGLKQNIEELLSLTNDSTGPKDTNTNEIDDEYALFMSEMEKEGAVNITDNDSNNGSKNSIQTQSYKELEGKKFRAPHKHQWGQIVYHNAMVCSVPNEIPLNNEFEVRVLFLNPTHKEMLPCPYYFDLERDCNFSEEQCHFSHGELVPFSSLEDYIEPKFELLVVGSAVLAKQSNNLWYRAKIKHISKDTCTVKFDSKNCDNKDYEEIVFENILPLVNSEDYSGDDSDNSDIEGDIPDSDNSQLAKEREDIINMSLMNTPDTQALGQWEKYTKGIGSKLMEKMGYIVGAGLGKDGSGIVKPVTALILPQGKSLDFCMNLKEQCNNPNLFSAERKVKALQRKVERRQKRLEEQQKKRKSKEKMDVCEFINFTLRGSKSKSDKEEQNEQQLKEKLKSGTDKELNVACFTIEENIKKEQM